MKKIAFTNEFKKEFKLSKKRGKKEAKLLEIIRLLQNEEKIPEKHRLHTLSGNFKNCYELHIEPDWLLIFRMTDDSIILLRTGTHSDLF
ncbi:MAG: type II toxin-antitoxin system YafQ family toxin [Chlamydiales bacterium]|nr:type II toxin-antitoxin system YafQ family toxin [Chlamydiales bacterium]